MTESDLALLWEIDGHVVKFFNGDIEKADLWWNEKNPMLGNSSPYDMVDMGRIQKLAQAVEKAVLVDKFVFGEHR